MQEQNNFKYIYKGKEISQEEFNNLTNSSFKWFNGSIIRAEDFDSAFSFFAAEKPFKGVLSDLEKEAIETSPEEKREYIKECREKFGIGSAYKESDGKLNYELDWEFIQQMAERMSQNKDKYTPYNWKKSMDVEKLKQSLFRHVIEVMKSNYSNDNRSYGHLESVALNALFINYQLKVQDYNQPNVP